MALNLDDENAPDPWNPEGQHEWYSMLEDEGRQAQLDRLQSIIPHLPQNIRHAVSLVLSGSSWREAAQVVYGCDSEAGGARLQARLRHHYGQIQRIRMALRQQQHGAPLQHLAKTLGLDHTGSARASTVCSHLKRWRAYYGL